MKYLNIYLLALLTIFIVGCSDDDPAMNSASTTVSFTQSEVTFNENAGIVKVPLTIEGERNGMIKVTFKVEDGSAIILLPLQPFIFLLMPMILLVARFVY